MKENPAIIEALEKIARSGLKENFMHRDSEAAYEAEKAMVGGNFCRLKKRELYEPSNFSILPMPIINEPLDLLSGQSVKNIQARDLYRAIHNGFLYKNAKKMAKTFAPNIADTILINIIGDCPRHKNRTSPRKLNAFQSLQAYKYATLLNQASQALGTYELAEEWVGNKNPYLGGEPPLNVATYPLGFEMLIEYLLQIEYGVYI